MEQEARNSLLTTFTNFFETQAHGSRSNNNNSNTRTSAITARNRVESTASQAMNAHLLNVTSQLSSGGNGPGTNSDMSGLDGLSVLTNSSYPFPDTSANSGSQDTLYDAGNHIGMSTNVNPYSSSMMDFSGSQSHQMLEPFQTLDTNTSLSCAQSYVSLLQQQPGDVWSGQADPNVGSYANKHPVAGECRPQSNQTLQQVPSLNDSSLHQQSTLQKSGNQSQLSRLSAVNRGSRLQPYNQNSMMQFDSGARHGSKHPTEMLMSLDGSDALQFTNDMRRKHGMEKNLTTTPIPSDADKSSCSSASSDGISGPEQSPDHLIITDHPSSVSNIGHHNMDDNTLMADGKQKRDNCSMRNLDTTKSCRYGSMNLVNFGTINFAPVMDSNSVDITSSSQQQEGNMPLPTSDSVVEIADGSSPLENIPLSPNTPTASDNNALRTFADAHNVHPSLHGSYSQMRNVSIVSNGASMDNQPNGNARKSKAHHAAELRKTSVDVNNNAHTKLSQNGYNKNFVSLSTVTANKLEEKQKKTRMTVSKHKHHNASRRGDYSSEANPNQYGYVSGQTANTTIVKPKMNADPMLSGRQSYNSVVYSGQPHHNDNTQELLNNSNPSRNSQHMKTRFPNQNADSGVPVSNTSNPSSNQTRVWQTVTAVQGKKLPPMLSEQDRIPKRGRPSKKMMQQNLKIKAAQNQAPAADVAVVKPQPEVVPTPSRSSNLVAMYTINDKGDIEEIAPKPKESRRSKERNEAFLKYLDQIKTSSKNQQLVEGVKGSGNKEGEKQKKKSRSRNKVFGRQTSQPLTESGITQTMCTFSALAHQFKISHSIVERATENLLKSVAIKRSKEQHNATTAQQQKRRPPEKTVSDQREISKNSVGTTICTSNKNITIAESMLSHCDERLSSNSGHFSPTPEVGKSTSGASDTHLQPTDAPVARLAIKPPVQNPPRNALVLSNGATKDRRTSKPKIADIEEDEQEYPEPSPESPAVPLSPDAVDLPLDSNVDDEKTKRKKKKPKKHKKHKHSEPGSGKKKRKDKDRKKNKKRDKPKSTPIPSASVSLSRSNKTVSNKVAQSSPNVLSPESTQPTATEHEQFPSSSMDKAKHGESNPTWSVEEATFDTGDSSSDDTAASIKSFQDTNSQLFSSSAPSSIYKSQPSFSLYSQSRIGFGTFSMEKSPSQRIAIPDKEIGSCSSTQEAAIAKSGDNDSSTFTSQGMLRSSKKHTKYKKKKLLRKSKTCDPAFVATVDKLLTSLKNITLDLTVEKTASLSHMTRSNVFLATGASDPTPPSSLQLWRTPGRKSAKKVASSSNSNHRSSSMFPKNCDVPGFGGNKQTKKAEFRLRKSKNAAVPTESCETSSISVFCRAPFFQKHGYVTATVADVTTSSMSVSMPQTATKQSSKSKSSKDAKNSTAKKVSEKETPRKPDESSKSSTKSTLVEKVSNTETRDTVDVARTARKRGRPPGKSNARSKKRKLNLPVAATQDIPSPSTSQARNSEGNNQVSPELQKIVSKPSKVNKPPKSKRSECEKEATDEAGTSKPSTSTNLVNDTLLQQIKQAIEANLPKHPSVNKEAIAKSVDAAVQSYLQTLSNTQPVEDQADKEREPKSPNRNDQTGMDDDSTKASQLSPKNNSDIHPKKLWACKHQDTATSTLSNRSNNSAAPLKRGRGRPRKYPITSSLKSKPSVGKKSRQSTPGGLGKVPTASATVLPSKRKVLTVKIRGKCIKPDAKRILPRAKTSSVSKNTTSLPRTVHSTITNQAALSCLSALCSLKAAKVLAKSADKNEDSEISMYSDMNVREHITETIDRTVAMYSWDNYQKFQESCMNIATEMGFLDEIDLLNSDPKSKNPVIKKSIESVVEKLKNKQAQCVHKDVTNVLLHLRKPMSSPEHVIVGDTRSMDSVMYQRAGRRQYIYEKVSTFEDSLQSSKLHKVKQAGHTDPVRKSKGVGVPVKRGRGRPRIHSPDASPSKKRKLSGVETMRKGLKSHDSNRNVRLFKETIRQESTSTPAILSNVEKDPTSSPHKEYLNAGLYSSTFKQDKPERSRSISSDDLPMLLATKWPQLPPPVDAGLHVRTYRQDFQLPYKIWWMYKHEKISVSQDPSNNYIEITENVVATPKSSTSNTDHICGCSAEDKEHCGQNCLNRMMYIECDATTCPHGLRCSNRAMQGSMWCESLKRFKTEDRGWGVKTSHNISEGSFILEYVGEVVSETEFRKRSIELYHAYNNHYCVQLDSSNVIDGYRMANIGRFVNHSCEPNCEMQKWCVNGEHRIGLFARRCILPNEELTYDYNFHAYNMDTQQRCRCASQKCRGFIGGRTQRSFSSDSDCSTNSFGSNTTNTSILGKQSKLKAFKTKEDESTVKDFSTLQMKPIPRKERELIRTRQLFLMRNLTLVRRKEEEEEHRRKSESSVPKSRQKSKPKKSQQSKEDKKKLELAITEMYTAIATCKDQNGVSVAIPFMNLPSKKKNPEYYERISDPIDLSIIEHNIVSNHYKSIEAFNNDVQRVFKNAEKYHGKKSTLGKDVFRLRKAYAHARGAAMLLLNGHEKPTKSSEVSDVDEINENIHRKNEDHIRCICQIYRDEGLMVQCEKCYVWQHCDCIGVNPEETEHYLCEECDPRHVPREVKVIPPPPNTPPGHSYYLTLLRDDLLVKQGDCVYLIKEHRLSHNNNSSSLRASYRNTSSISHEKLKIFRIEQLWTDERGDKYGYGYYFLRPHETHHAPSRFFYHNELFVSPFYEIIPLEAVVGLCCVMDLYTYCKGKPKDFKTRDLYICDFRVDKAASSFNRINKKKYPICTKSHVFDTYKQKLTPKKDYQPHKVPEQYRRSCGRPGVTESFIQDVKDPCVNIVRELNCDGANDGNVERGKGLMSGELELGSTSWRKRERLDGIANKLLSKLPAKGDDISYLLGSNNAKHRQKKSSDR